MQFDRSLDNIISRFLSPSGDEGGITPDEFEQLAAEFGVRVRGNTARSMHQHVISIGSYGIRFEYTKGRPKPRFAGLCKARSEVRVAVEQRMAKHREAGERFSAALDTLAAPAGVAL